MLTLTENASSIVNEITSQIEGEDAGLRITAQNSGQGDAPDSFGISASEHAEPGDQVVEQAGAKVYLEIGAATALDDKILDAGVDDSGNVQFALGQQA